MNSLEMIRLGSIVTLPSGKEGQVEKVREYWKRVPCSNRIKERRELLFYPCNSKEMPFWVADYMIVDVQDISECGG